jgi:hypothetical protein
VGSLTALAFVLIIGTADRFLALLQLERNGALFEMPGLLA